LGLLTRLLHVYVLGQRKKEINEKNKQKVIQAQSWRWFTSKSLQRSGKKTKAKEAHNAWGK